MENKKKKIDLHFILKQGRHLICFLVVVVVVFCYTISCFATVNYNSSASIASYFSISTPSNMPILTYDNIALYYQTDGGDMNDVRGLWNGFYRMNSNNVAYMTTVWNNFVDNISIPLDISKDGTTYDLENARWMFFPVSTWDSRLYAVPIIGSGNISIVNGYLVSNSPFTFFRLYYISSAWDWGNSNVYQVNNVSNNGLYCYDMTTFYNGEASDGIFFTDLPIFAGSVDGVTGYTTFSTDSTDFDFTNSNYDFNFLRTGNFIISPGEPLPDVGSNFGDYAKSRMNFSMNSYYTGGKLLNSAKHRVTINWPDVVRQNPENFYLKVEYTGKYKDDSLASTITFTRTLFHGQRYRLIPIITLMSENNGQLPSSFNIDVGLSSLVDANNKSMYRYFLDSVSSFSGVSDPESNNIWMNFLNTVGEAVYNFIYGEDDDLPLAQLARDIDSYIDVMEIEGYVSIMYDKDSDNYITGANHSKFDFKSGNSETLGTDNTINQYPEEGQDIYNVPSVGGGSTSNYNQNAPVAYGGVVQLENNVNAMIEYLFNIDASDYLNIVGNTHSAIQETFNTLTNTSQNGAWSIMEQSFALIPDEIWSWIKSAVAVILGGSIISWVLYFRVKKG